MPTLQPRSKVERLYLPSTKDVAADSPDCAWVDMEVGPLTAADIVGIDPRGDEVTGAIKMLANRIKGWSYTDVSGETLGISFDTVKQLDMADFAFLAEQLPKAVEGLADVEKKS